MATSSRERSLTAVTSRAIEPNGKRLAYIDGVRALAALYVLLHHTWLEIWPVYYGRHPSGLTLLLTGWLSYGHFGVSVFIVVSGFCLMLPVVRGNGELPGGPTSFLKRRARRILPPYYLAIGFSLLLIWLYIGQKTGTHWDISVPNSGQAVLVAVVTDVLLVQDVVGIAIPNHVFWSIAVEWQIYFFFPILLMLGQLFGRLRMTVVVIFISYVVFFCLLWTGVVSDAEPAAQSPQFLGLFALGMLGASVAAGREEHWQGMRDRVKWGTLALCAFAAVCIECVLRGTQDIVYVDLLVGICAMSILICCTLPRQRHLRRVLEWKPLVFVGTFSYSLYLIHAPLIQMIWQYMIHPLHLPDTLTFGVLLIVGAPLILVTAYVFYLIAERPFLLTAGNTKHREPNTPALAQSLDICQ